MNIISLAPNITEILLVLNIKPVGVTNYCPDIGVPKIGSWTNLHDFEAIEKLNPDMMIGFMYVPDNVRDYCNKKGIELHVFTANSLEDLYGCYRLIAELLGTQPDDLISKTQRSLKQMPERNLKVYSEEFHEPPTVAGNWVPQLIKLAGGIPMIEEGQLSPEVTYEMVDEFDPDVVILHWCGFKDKSSIKKFNERWPELRAVKEKQVFVADDTYINRPGPNLGKGLDEFIKILNMFK